VRSILFLKALKAKAKKAQSVQAKERNPAAWARLVKQEKSVLSKAHLTDPAQPIRRHPDDDRIVMLDTAAPQTWGEIEGIANLNAHYEHRKLRRWKAMSVSIKESKVKQALSKKPCACNGVQNRHGHGSKCKDWEGDGTSPWCYVSFSCMQGTTSRDMSGVKWVTCKRKEKAKLKTSHEKLGEKLAIKSHQAQATGACGCSGTKNSRGEGGKCRHWGSYAKAWCYVSVACNTGYVSQEIAGTKWVTDCNSKKGSSKQPSEEDKKEKFSSYHQLKLELGEGLQAHGQGRTRTGWSWGVLLPSNTPYPACIDTCHANAACVGVSYATSEVPSNDPAASSVKRNTCNQFQGITQNNKNPL